MGERREPALMEAGLLRTWGGAYGLNTLRGAGGTWDTANRMIIGFLVLQEIRVGICGVELGEARFWGREGGDQAWLTDSVGNQLRSNDQTHREAP